MEAVQHDCSFSVAETDVRHQVHVATGPAKNGHQSSVIRCVQADDHDPTEGVGCQNLGGPRGGGVVTSPGTRQFIQGRPPNPGVVAIKSPNPRCTYLVFN